MPKVSVAMAAYNHERYVGAALRSVLDQSFRDFEIVVTDDASRDRTPEEIRAVGDPRISLQVFPRNLGAPALNASIERSRGEYIAILNSDDVFLPGKLEKQVAWLDSHPETGAVFGYPVFLDAKGNPLADEDTFYKGTFRVQHRTRAAWLRHFFFHGNALCHPSVLIRRHCYDVLGLYNPALAQLPDFEMWIRLLHRFDIHLIEEPLVGFRILAGGQNASAGRPDAVVRLQWEWLRVLEHYLTLDPQLLAQVFPELPARRARPPYPRWLVKLARRGLQRYTQRAATGTGAEPAPAVADADTPVSWFLGQIAIRVGNAPHVLFGLNAMHRAAVELDDPACYRDLIGLTGSYDVFDVLSKAPPDRRPEKLPASKLDGDS